MPYITSDVTGMLEIFSDVKDMPDITSDVIGMLDITSDVTVMSDITYDVIVIPLSSQRNTKYLVTGIPNIHDWALNH